MNTKILIVDDSRIFRSAVQQGLSGEKDIQVIGSVWNGVKAIEFLKSNDPDIVTLDIEMPEMDGLETLKAIQKINSTRPADKQIGVIMLSSHTRKGADITVKALELGAYDFIPKPEGKDLARNLSILCSQLIVKIRNYASRFIPHAPQQVVVAEEPPATPAIIKEKIIRATAVKALLIGVSTGGPKALAEIMPDICEGIDLPILVVQHMPPTFTVSLAKSLDAKCRYTIVEAENDTPLQKQHAYIAPGGRHMVLQKVGNETRIMINDQAPEKGCRPSVDKLFRSAAEIFRQHAIGVILTGMGTDGTEGGRMMKEYGAPIIIQDEPSSVVWGMPGSAYSAGIADTVLPLRDIPQAIIQMIR